MASVIPLETPYPDYYQRAEALADEITELCSYLYAAEYQLLVKIREFDENGYWGGPGLASCAHWLNFKCGMGMNAARERVRVARALADLPKISAAFEAGTLSYSKVRAMTRVATPESEDFLLNIARHGTAYHVETLVRKYRRVQRQRDVDTANAIHVTRELTYYWDEDGALVFHGRLPAEQGAAILKALEMQMEKRFQEERAPGDVHTDKTSPAAPGPVHTDVSAETSDGPEARSPVAARRADALAEIAERYMNSEPAANNTADRYQVIVHVSAETSYLDNGPHVSADYVPSGVNIPAHRLRLQRNQGKARRGWRASGHRATIAAGSARHTACITAPRRRLPVPGLHPQALRRCAPHRALEQGRRDEPGQPGAALPRAPPPCARGRLQLREVPLRRDRLQGRPGAAPAALVGPAAAQFGRRGGELPARAFRPPGD